MQSVQYKQCLFYLFVYHCVSSAAGTRVTKDLIDESTTLESFTDRRAYIISYFASL